MSLQAITAETMIPFLIRTAIPCVQEKNKLPEENMTARDHLIWDAVYRAHRDVLTGRKHVASYSKETIEIEEPQAGNQRIVNHLALKLYQTIKGNNDEALSSERLLQALGQAFSHIGLGPKQKLVNMTLKYLVILQAFGYIDCKICIAECDCPLDSIILERLKEDAPYADYDKKIRWTQLGTQEDDKTTYQKIQNAISEIVQPFPKLKYDFKNWQELEKAIPKNK